MHLKKNKNGLQEKWSEKFKIEVQFFSYYIQEI